MLETQKYLNSLKLNVKNAREAKEKKDKNSVNMCVTVEAKTSGGVHET